jgi:hypothetical protein
MRGVIPPLPKTFSWHGAWLSNEHIFIARYLIKHKGNLTLTSLLHTEGFYLHSDSYICLICVGNKVR